MGSLPDPTVQQLVVPVAQIIWAGIIGTLTLAVALGVGAWKFWGATRDVMREETAPIRAEVARVREDLAKMEQTVPEKVRAEVRQAVTDHEVSEARNLVTVLEPLRDRLVRVETLIEVRLPKE